MRCVQRLNGQTQLDNTYIEWLIDAHHRFPNSFSDIWLSTAYGYPTLEKHASLAKELAKSASMFRENGIRVSLQLSNTIGHGQYIGAKDCSALEDELKNAMHLVGHDGTVAEYSFCWRDGKFLEYLEEQLYWYVTQVRPEEVWLDDDLRANNHSPVQYGCFCEKCIEKFNKKYGYQYDRETLVSALFTSNIRLRQQWTLFTQEGLGIFTERICKKIVSVKKDTKVGLQNGPNGCYAGHGYEYLLDAIYRATGNDPMYRAGAGAYQDYQPMGLVEKAYCLAYQYAILPEYVTELYSEVENTPNTAMGKTMYGTAFEASLYFALGASDCSFAMLGVVPEDTEFYEKGFEKFEKFFPYWKKLEELSAKTYAGGLWNAYAKEPQLSQTGTMEFYDKSNDLLRCGVPLSYDLRGCKVVLLHPDVARQMQKEELCALLKQCVLTDASTVAYMQSQGIELGFQMRTMLEHESMHYREIYTEHPVNKFPGKSFKTGYFTTGNSGYELIESYPINGEVIGEYSKNHTIQEVSDVIFTTKEGGKWAVIGYGLWKSNISSVQRNRIQDVIDYLEPNAMPARILSSVQGILIPRVSKDDGSTVAVSIVNCTIEEQENVAVEIRQTKGAVFLLHTQEKIGIELKSEKTKDGYIVTVSKVKPWEIVTIEVN